MQGSGGRRQSSVGSLQLAGGSGQFSVGSFQLAVFSWQWAVGCQQFEAQRRSRPYGKPQGGTAV